MIDIIKFLSKLLFAFLLINIVCAPPALLADDAPPEILAHDHGSAVVPVRTKAVVVALISDMFTGIENDIFEEAAYTIEYQTNDTIKVILVSERDIHKPLLLPMNATIFPVLVRKVQVEDPQVIEVDKNIKGPMLGFYDGKASSVPTIKIAYERIQFVDEYIGIFTHELGHAIGMEHSAYKEQLMYPSISNSCFGVRDLLQISHLFGNNPDMNPCETDADWPVCLDDMPINY